jgi:hypothetical protein
MTQGRFETTEKHLKKIANIVLNASKAQLKTHYMI